MAETRIDIAVNEKGSSDVTRALHSVADALQSLSPTAAMSMRGRALRVGVSTDKLVKKVAMAVLDKVVHATPHDTGQARANWKVTVQETSPSDGPFFGELDYDGDRTVAEGQSIMGESPREAGQTIWISNALPYIEALNDGWSNQAAAGFVGLAVQQGSTVARNSKLLEK